jgi:formylglycine-generating enzyme required for sulfatase activity
LKTISRIIVALFAISGAAATAAETRVEQALHSAQEIAALGNYEHAVARIEMAIIAHPDDQRLLALRDHLVQARARAAGNPSARPVEPVPLPAIAKRRPEPGRNFTVETGEIAMIWIAPGKVLLRNPRGSDDDTVVTLTRGYWLGRTEVTQEQLQAVMEHLPSQSQFRGSDLPAERVSWLSAMEFGRIVTERERAAGRLPPDYEYTLPSEAQWEYACRAGTTGPHAGDLDAMAWFAGNSDRRPHPVGQKQPNAWGLYDMHGNVAEWCIDGYHGYPGGHVTDFAIGYDGPSAAMARMVRGGWWQSGAGLCRSGSRNHYLVTHTGSDLGFRLALVPVR